ncbi:hypothetical protein KM043_003533 [Ampulex compressa]|nr:hypothetical protein KM043_003533 [Ampulex compressa]
MLTSRVTLEGHLVENVYQHLSKGRAPIRKLNEIHHISPTKFCKMNRKAFVGPVIHSNEDGELIVIERAAILIENGKINSLIENQELLDTKGLNTTILKPGQFLVPGFIDGHIHAVQFPNLGVGYDKELLDWLNTYTFPLEKKYADEEFAQRVFDAVVRRTINAGTTTACYFASLYAKASVILAQKAVEFGQRCLVGKISMNAARSDQYYENSEDSMRNIKEFINSILDINSPLVQPIITPRFALSCDMNLMKELSKLAKEKDLHIQSHVSENLTEIEVVRQTYPNYPSYVAVYDGAGLLTNKTVLAHGVHLTDDEISLLRDRNTAIIHCPSSNTCLKSGLCDVQRLKSKGIRVGLGTDVSGGQSLSILDAMRSALQVSVHLSFSNENYRPLDYKDVFYMATLGGAKALALDEKIGNFTPGKEFDALIVDVNAETGLLDNLTEYTLEDQFQRFIYSGDDRNISQVYISGRKVK